MTEEQFIHHLALTMLPQIGDVHIGNLLSHIPDPVDVFKADDKTLESIPGIGTIRARSIRQFKGFGEAEKEIRFAKENKILVLVKGDKGYPERLNHCADAPHVLFYKGSAQLNQEKVVSVIGTRSPTAYGSERVGDLIGALAAVGVLVVSGLAYGIDTQVHKACLKKGMETVGVLGHGLDRIYPFSNRALAAQMTTQGGLLTEFTSGTRPCSQHFPMRNRIVAGMADAVIVVESGEKGGSLITAALANSYNKDVLAYPGRAIDAMSLGCNRLIRQNQAAMVCSGMQVLEYMNWAPSLSVTQAAAPRQLPELSADEKKVMDVLHAAGTLHVDVLMRHTQFSASQLSAVLILLEMNGCVASLPGRMYAAAGTGA